jgi:Xaa-Pro aminopeptidase
MDDAWIRTAQAELARQGLAGWLIYDFRGSNPFAARFLELGGHLLSRRLFALVPVEGRPILLLSVLEAGSVRADGFEVRAYAGRASLEQQLRRLLPGGPVAMEVSPRADLPYVSVVDAGTVELLRELGAEVVSSAELLQAFAAWTPWQIERHRVAARGVMEVLDEAWAFLRSATERGDEVRETDVQAVIADGFERRGLVSDHGAIVGFGPHGGDPHYLPRPGEDRALTPGDPILIDLFARSPEDGAPYADVTWMGVYGEADPAFARAFEAVVAARDRAVELVREAWRAGRTLQGREVDRAVRDQLTDAGYGDAFLHRTGHSLGWRHTHGDAVHLDDFETRDVRELRAGVGVTIEPGVYLPAFGVRSELDLVLTEDGPEVTTGEQRELVRIAPGPSGQAASARPES